MIITVNDRVLKAFFVRRKAESTAKFFSSGRAETARCREARPGITFFPLMEFHQGNR